MSARGQRWLTIAPFATVVMAALAVLVLAADVVLVLTLPASLPSYDAQPASTLIPILPFVATGGIAVLLATRRPANPVGWLLGALVIAFGYSGVSTAYLYHALYATDLPPGFLLPLLLSAAAVPLPALFFQLLLVFPDGHLLSPGWRPLAWLNVGLAAITGFVSMVDPAVAGDGHRQAANPLGHLFSEGVRTGMGNGLTLAWFGLGAAVLLSVVLRYRRAGAELREQLKWFGVGAVAVALGLVVATATATSPAWATPPPIIASTIGFSALPVCIGIAVLKYRLYDIDVVIGRALVYGSLAGLVTVIYVGIVVGVGALLGGGSRPNLALSILATGVVALGFQPARERLNRLANRLVYGRRATPYEVLAEFSERVAGSVAGADLLPRMARILAEGTGAELAEVWLHAGASLTRAAAWPANAALPAPLAVSGQLLPPVPGSARAVPVRHQGELLGALTVTKRRAETLSPIEVKLMDDLGRQAGLVLKNVGLTADLQARLQDLRASRQRLVAAQDAERRRLERNLHDGAQQYLVAIKVKLGLAEALTRKDPARAGATLTEIKLDADEALETLRDLARGIYPPLLADRGLVAALEAHARKATVPVDVAGEGIGRYSQDTEAAVYFCSLEALQNVQKYAEATCASVRLREVGGLLHFEIEDDGRGFDAAGVARGAGLQNMTDRIDALGGRLDIDSAPGKGTRVAGQLPVAAISVATPP